MDYTSFIFSRSPQDVHAPIFVDADHPNRVISWQEYVSGVKRVAVGLQQLGVKEQDCVALISPNDIYFSILGDAVVASGAIFASPAATAQLGELVTACVAANVKWLFATPALMDKALATAKECGILDDRVLLFDPPGSQDACSTTFSGRLGFSTLAKHDADLYTNLNSSKDPRQLIATRPYTSGTTGAPKAASRSHAANVSQLGSELAALSSMGPKLLHFIGMHHISGTLLREKTVAGFHCMYVTAKQDPEELIDLIRQHNITGITLPPRTMIAVTEVIESGIRRKADIQTLTNIVIGGSQVSDVSMDSFLNLLSSRASLHIGYGSTEMGAVSNADWSSRGRCDMLGFVGTVHPVVEVKVFNPDTHQDVGLGVNGEICARGLGTFNEYCGNPKATESAFLTDSDGKRWFRSGDKGLLTADGELFVTGRFKEVFKVGSEELAPIEVELVLMQHPGVQDVAVTPTKDRKDSTYNEVKSYVVKKDKKEVTAQELVNFVAQSLSLYKAPTGGVAFLDEIPRNAMKKVIRRELDTLKLLPGSADYLDVQQ